MPKLEKTFDKAAYDREYHRQHYRRAQVTLTKEEAARVEEAATAAGLTKSAYIRQAIKEKLERE